MNTKRRKAEFSMGMVNLGGVQAQERSNSNTHPIPTRYLHSNIFVSHLIKFSYFNHLLLPMFVNSAILLLARRVPVRRRLPHKLLRQAQSNSHHLRTSIRTGMSYRPTSTICESDKFCGCKEAPIDRRLPP